MTHTESKLLCWTFDVCTVLLGSLIWWALFVQVVQHQMEESSPSPAARAAWELLETQVDMGLVNGKTVTICPL